MLKKLGYTGLIAATLIGAAPAMAAFAPFEEAPATVQSLDDNATLWEMARRGRGRGADDGTADEGPGNDDDGPDDDEDDGVHQCRGCDDGPNHT